MRRPDFVQRSRGTLPVEADMCTGVATYVAAAGSRAYARRKDVLDFGKCKGIHEVDGYYLEWMLDRWKAAGDEVLTRRGEVKRQHLHDLLSKLKSCSRKRDLQEGKRLHTSALEAGNDTNKFVAAALINMYAKCGSMVDAKQVFDSIEEPDVVSWNSLILGYADNGDGQAALNVFSMKKVALGCAPNPVTYIAAIKGCTSMAVDEAGKAECLRRGKELHMEIRHHINHLVQSTLINMYAKCGSMVDAQQVFDSIKEPDVVSWNSLILGYVDNGESQAALDLFSRMKCAPNSVTYIAAIKACTPVASDEAGKGEYLKWGREVHINIGHHIMSCSVQSTLINMYAKCGSMVDAQLVFDSIQEPDVVSWNTLILGYASNGEGEAALDFFSRMKDSRKIVPSSVTYVAVFKACGSIGALTIGRKIHSEITDFVGNVVTSLVDFYAKCGSMVEAREVFDLHLKARNIGTWTALLTGYGLFGDTSSIFKLFEAMQDQGFRPDAVTFVCILSCCSHAGLVKKAMEYLQAMPVQYQLTPSVKHYTCMVDVLGRANQLDEAVAFLQKMPCNPDDITWATLLAACRKWKNVEIGKFAFQSLGEKSASAYVLMAEIYGRSDLWKDQTRVLETKRAVGTWKLAGQAYVMDEVGKMVKFVAESDPPEVKHKLKQFLEDMKEQGYVAESYNTSLNEPALCSHAEKSAVVYGILKTPLGEPVRAFKNMRMCDDCHWTTKVFSKLSQRIIFVRDESRFHVMENGNCSCGDYW